MKRFLAVALAVLAVACGADASTTPLPKSFFGMTSNNPATAGHYPACGTFGAFRMWDTRVSWVEANPSSGTFDFSKVNAQLAQANACGDVSVTYTFGHTPGWASLRPSEACTGGIGHQNGSCAPPSDVATTDQHLKDFTTALVNDSLAQPTHIKYYEIWNEPNSTNFFTGTQAQLVRMGQDIYAIVHSLDPNALVIGPSPSGCTAGGCNSFPWLTAYYAAGGTMIQDAVGFHAYMHDNQADPTTSLFSYISQLQSLMNANGISSKPIIFTEGSWGDGTADGFGGGVLTQDQRTAYLATMYLQMYDKGIAGFDWYSYDSTSFGPLCDNTTTNCPLFPPGAAYGRLKNILVGSVKSAFNTCTKGADSTWQCPIVLSNGVAASWYWNPTTTKNFSVDASLGYTTYKTLDADTTNNITGGAVPIGPKPIIAMGSIAPPPPSITLSVTPSAVEIQAGTTASFVAHLVNDVLLRGALWALTGPCSGSACGTLDNTASQTDVAVTYTAPLTPPSGHVTLTATSVADTSISDTADILVDALPTPPPPPPQNTQVKGQAVIGVGPSLPITIQANPPSFAINTALSQNILVTIANDSNNQGVNVTVVGPGCSGSSCGTVNLGFVRNGQTIIYTAPATAPSPNSVSIVLTSVQNPATLIQIPVTINGVAPPSPTVPLLCHPNTQAAVTTNIFVCAATTSPNVIIPVATSTADVISSVQACSPTDVCTTLTQNCPVSGPCIATTVPGGDVTFWSAFGLPLGLTRFKVNNSTPSGSIDPVVYDAPNIGGFDKAFIAAGNSTPAAGTPATTNPIGPSITPSFPNELVIAMLSSTGTVSNAAAPFNFTPTVFGNGDAWVIAPTTATLTPNWTSASGTWAGMIAAYTAGTGTGAISVTLSPATANVQVSATQAILPTISNDTTGATATVSVTGAGCTGTGCGTTSVSTATNGVSFNYIAPAVVPSPATVTITACSTTDPTKCGSAVITIGAAPVLGISILPTNPTVAVGGGQSFTVTLTNDVSHTAALTVTGAGCGGAACGITSVATATSGAAFTYTAPATAPTPATVTLTATATDDGVSTATANIVLSSPVTPSGCIGASCPAFFGTFGNAQGSGAETIPAPRAPGSPVVMEVTNLNDSGAGSLRNCITGSGPRTCIFRVAGVIHAATSMRATSPYLYIAGQSAPGSGITLQGDNLSGGSMIFVATHDVIIRYITCRIGLGGGHTAGPGNGADCWELGSSNQIFNVILDHNSSSWWDNKGFITACNSDCFTAGINKFTVQFHLDAEPNVNHPVGPMTDATCPDGPCGSQANSKNNDFHHNMYHSIDHRMPLFNTKSGRWVSNLIWNPGSMGADFLGLWQGGSTPDIIANKVVNGNLSNASIHEYQFNNTPSSDMSPSDMPGPPAIYMLNNVNPHNSAVTNVANDASQTVATTQGSEGGGNSGPAVPGGWFRSTPLAAPVFPITPDPANNLDSVLLATVGNSQSVDLHGNPFNRRDAVDQRLILSYQNRTSGSFFSVVDATHTVPTPTNTPGAYVSTLHDGIADQWKTDHGLSLVDVNLWKTIDPATKVTYLENFINGVNP